MMPLQRAALINRHHDSFDHDHRYEHRNSTVTPRRNPSRRARPSFSTPPDPKPREGRTLRLQQSSQPSSSDMHEPLQENEKENYQSTPRGHRKVGIFSSLPQEHNFEKNCIEVLTNVQVFRLQKIDSSTEEYCLDAGLTFIWHDPKLVPQINGHYYSTHPSIVKHAALKDVPNVLRWPDELRIGEDTFDPAWKILNSSEVNIVKTITTVLDADLGKVHNYVHVRATIDQSLDLHDFPFDRQKLQFRLQSEHPSTCMKFLPFPDRKPKIFAGDNSEWQFSHPTLPEIKLINDTTAAAASGVVYASITAEFHALRKPEWYMWNVVFTSFAIVFSSFSMFCLDENARSDRLNLLFTTWLMLISVKFIISDRLPKISYFSVLDYYITFSYILMVILIVHVCTNYGSLRENYFTFSFITEPDMFVLVSCLWIGVHCLMLWKYHKSNGWEIWGKSIRKLA